jgi:hypothetical protein
VIARRLAIALALVAFAIAAVRARRTLIHAWTTYDAEPGDAPELPRVVGPGLPPASRVRVALVDGLAADVARALPAWSATCERGTTLGVDVGFPTVSLPVEVALWTGLTQQQTGVVFRSDQPIVPPLANSIPARVGGSIAIAESHGYIVRSLGFARSEPAAQEAEPARDADADAWKTRWETQARDAVASDARLVFVHVLRVDVAGHRYGRDSDEYRATAREADAIVGALVAAAPDARWFLLSDHGHLASGGHGGEEREVRHVDACIAGPGIAKQRGELVHVVDVARAIADSAGVALDPASRARPLAVAIARPLGDDDAVPPLALPRALVAIGLLVGGALATIWVGLALGPRRTARTRSALLLVPWWYVLALALFVAVRGAPTLSTPMIYRPYGWDMAIAWLAALPIATAAAWLGITRTSVARVVTAQLALPVATAAAALAASGAWPAVFGAEIAPVVPRFTAWTSPLILLAAQGAAAVALAVLGTLFRQAIDRRRSSGSPRTARAAG